MLGVCCLSFVGYIYKSFGYRVLGVDLFCGVGYGLRELIIYVAWGEMGGRFVV